MQKRLLVFASICGLAAAGALIASCGARSQLDVAGGNEGGGGGALERDAGHDARRDAPKDAPPDVPIDVPPPPDCIEAGMTTYVYLMTAENNLLAFYPPDPTQVINRGTIDCPAAGGASPYSMAVDRSGTAYVVFDDGELFRVSTLTAKCEATPFVPNQHGFKTFGMGFSSNADDSGESLYVVQIDESQNEQSKGLGKIDVDTFKLDFIGPFSQNFGDAMELTGTGDAKLYGYMLDNPGSGGHVLEIDKSNADVLSATHLGAGDSSDALAFASWGGAFYIFTATLMSGTTHVHQWIPQQGVTEYAEISGIVVGAGVSTCAPLH